MNLEERARTETEELKRRIVLRNNTEGSIFPVCVESYIVHKLGAWLGGHERVRQETRGSPGRVFETDHWSIRYESAPGETERVRNETIIIHAGDRRTARTIRNLLTHFYNRFEREACRERENLDDQVDVQVYQDERIFYLRKIAGIEAYRSSIFNFVSSEMGNRIMPEDRMVMDMRLSVLEKRSGFSLTGFKELIAGCYPGLENDIRRSICGGEPCISSRKEGKEVHGINKTVSIYIGSRFPRKNLTLIHFDEVGSHPASGTDQSHELVLYHKNRYILAGANQQRVADATEFLRRHCQKQGYVECGKVIPIRQKPLTRL